MLVILAAVSADAVGEEFRIGDEKVKIPTPEGFVRIDGVNSEFDLAVERFIPDTTRLLAVFSLPTDLEALRKGLSPAMERRYMIQHFASAKHVTSKDFLQQKKRTEAEVERRAAKLVQGELDRVGESEGAHQGEKVTVKVGEQAVMKVLGSGEDWIGVGSRVPMEVTGPKGTEKVTATSVAAILHLGGGVVRISGTDLSGGEDLLDELKADVFAWKDQVLAANADLSHPGWFDWNVNGKYLVIGIAVVVIALIVVKSRRVV